MKLKKKKKKTSISTKKKKDLRIKKKEKRKWWKKILSLMLVCCSFGIFAVFGFCIYIVSTCGEFDPNALANQDQTVIYDSKGNLIAKLGIEKRESVNYSDLPQVLIDAIVATEDSRFFQHNGVDGARFVKAAFGQLLGNSSAGGASTLTMQVVKNNLTSRDQTIVRKFKDVYLAVFFMERKYTKNEILEFYVNDSLLGGNVYGVEEASKYYFGKSVSDLSLPEAALIAGLFQSPNGDNPYKNPENAQKRMKTVLKLMVRHGYITKEEADLANSIDVSSLLIGVGDSDNEFQGFIDTVVSEIIKKTDNDPALVSMEIHTTLDPDMQRGINKIMKGEGYKWVNDVVQAGITIIDVNSGAITAVGTGRNRTGERQWNYATQTKRQPGSTAKPIFAYAPGFELDNFSTYQLFVDEAWSYSDGTPFNNWDAGYQGLMTLRSALSVSRNVPAVKSLQTVIKDVGNKKVSEFVSKLGIHLTDNTVYEAYAIGGLDEGLTTAQMAAAYAAFANGGYYIEPYTVTSITYRENGETTEFEVKKPRVMEDYTAYLMTNVLEYAAHYGFSGGTSSYRGTVAAKTGTSNYTEAVMRAHGLPGYAVNDLWTVAYTPQYSIALWYGYDKIDSTYFNGSGAPKDQLMSAIMQYIPVTNEPFKMPESVVASQVEFGTWPAALPSQYTPADLIRTEYFHRGTQPTEVSDRFDKAKDVTNLKASYASNAIKLSWKGSTPSSADEAYLKEYFSQSVWGNSGAAMLQDRLNYNNNTLGGFGYHIYLKTNNGLTDVGFTKEENFTYTPKTNGKYNFVVKAGYRNLASSISDGVNVSVDVSGVKDNDTSQLVLTMVGEKNLETSLGSYKEMGIKVSYSDEDVTDSAKITYVVDGKRYTSTSELETYINSLTNADKYTIKYQVSYTPSDGDEQITTSTTRTVTLK